MSDDIPGTDPLDSVVLSGHNGSGCALMRLQVSQGDSMHLTLTECAKKAGMTYSEAWGVMAGWDGRHYAVQAIESEDYTPEDYARGVARGKRWRLLSGNAVD